MEKLDDVFSRCRLDPTDLEAVTYFLPRLLSGETMHGGAERMFHHVDIYACEPKDLAEAFAPVPQAEQSGDRFFLTTCKRLKGRGKRSARGAGDGKWSINTTRDIKDKEGVKVGEIKKLSFVSNSTGKATGWVMEEYRCLLPEAIVADGDKVLCKIHLAPNACDAARQESAAYKRRQESESVSAAQAPKRPAPVAADPPSPKKRMRMASPLLHQNCFDSQAFTIPRPAFLPDVSTETGTTDEADDEDMDRYTCSLEELLGGCGVQEEEKETLQIEAENAPSMEEIFGWLEDNEHPNQLLPSTSGDLKDPFDLDFVELLKDPLEFNCFDPFYST